MIFRSLAKISCKNNVQLSCIQNSCLKVFFRWKFIFFKFVYKNVPFIAFERLYNDDAFVGGAVLPQSDINCGSLQSPVHDLSNVMLGSVIFIIHFLVSYV
jgi:hypothetical protein